tara:strand:+ start:819 stop:992 length:174 start_codon:yes stop_codon:yes gene_type:complete
MTDEKENGPIQHFHFNKSNGNQAAIQPWNNSLFHCPLKKLATDFFIDVSDQISVTAL